MIRTFDHADVEELAPLRLDPGDQRPHRPAAPLPGARRPAHRAREPRRLGREDRGLDRRRQQHGQQLDQRRGQPRLRAPARLPRGLPAERRDPASATRAKAQITVTTDPREAARGAHVVNTDVWASMGQEAGAGDPRPGLPGLHRGRRPDAPGRPGGHLPPLPPRPPRRGGVATTCSRARSPASGTRPRTGCTCRRRSWRL